MGQGAPSTVARLGVPGWKPTAQAVGMPRSDPFSSTRVTSAPMRTTRLSSEVRGDHASAAKWTASSRLVFPAPLRPTIASTSPPSSQSSRS